MKITIDIPVSLYEKAKEALSVKTLKDAFENPLVMVCLHVITTSQQGTEWVCQKCGTTNMLDVPICQACSYPRSTHLRPTPLPTNKGY